MWPVLAKSGEIIRRRGRSERRDPQRRAARLPPPRRAQTLRAVLYTCVFQCLLCDRVSRRIHASRRPSTNVQHVVRLVGLYHVANPIGAFNRTEQNSTFEYTTADTAGHVESFQPWGLRGVAVRSAGGVEDRAVLLRPEGPPSAALHDASYWVHGVRGCPGSSKACRRAALRVASHPRHV